MSLYPVLWAAEHAPVRDAEERAILMALVMKGDFDGSNCFRSYGTLARVAKVDAKTAGRRCRAMEQRGILRRQTEHLSRAWLSIPREQRPVVWEVMIPADWWGPTQLAEINEQRESLGRAPLTRKNRPPLKEAPAKKARSDKGTKRPRKKPEPADPGTTSPGGAPGTTSPDPQDSQSPPPGLEVQQPSESPSESPSLSPPSPAQAPAPTPAAQGEGENTEPPKKPAEASPVTEVTEVYAKAYRDRNGVKPSAKTLRRVCRGVRELLDAGWEAERLKPYAAELPEWGTDLVKHVEANLRGSSLIPGQRSNKAELPEACSDHEWLPGQTDVNRRWREGPDGLYQCPACNPDSPRYPSEDISPPAPKGSIVPSA